MIIHGQACSFQFRNLSRGYAVWVTKKLSLWRNYTVTIDFNSTPGGGPTNSESDSPMFAATPAWERGKKRRSFGGSASQVEPEPRSFAADTSDRAPAAVMTGATAGAMASDPTTDSFAAAPSYATRPAHRRSATAPIVIAAGIILVGGLAAAGWYYTQPHAQGVAELTPGSASTTTATATTAGAPLPSEQVAQNTAAPAAAPEAAQPPVAPSRTMSTTTTTTHKAGPTVTHRTRTTVARARTATPSAPDVGADAATRAPAQAAPTPTPTPAAPPLVLNLPSASQPAPAPAPTQIPPAETPPQ
jgi:hypothetical protein